MRLVHNLKTQLESLGTTCINDDVMAYIKILLESQKTEEEFVNELKEVLLISDEDQLKQIVEILFKERQESSEEPMDIIITSSENNSVSPDNTTDTKKNTKCFFYPNCKNGEACEYFHPTNGNERTSKNSIRCKFSSQCFNPSCPYDHSGSVRSFRGSRKPFINRNKVLDNVSGKIDCKLGVECKNFFCRFKHPIDRPLLDPPSAKINLNPNRSVHISQRLSFVFPDSVSIEDVL